MRTSTYRYRNQRRENHAPVLSVTAGQRPQASTKDYISFLSAHDDTVVATFELQKVNLKHASPSRIVVSS